MGIFVIAIIVLIGVDQVVKYIASTNWINGEIQNAILNLTYYENSFMIGNISFNWLLVIISIILIIAFVLFFLNQYTKRVRTRMNLVIFTLIIAGGISNLIDRIARGFVIDYVELNYFLEGIVFNLADVFIVVGIILLIGMYAITITDDNVKMVNEGEEYVQNKSTKQWFRELFKNR